MNLPLQSRFFPLDEMVIKCGGPHSVQCFDWAFSALEWVLVGQICHKNANVTDELANVLHEMALRNSTFNPARRKYQYFGRGGTSDVSGNFRIACSRKES